MQFIFLRGLNAFVFEEMILTALKHQGYRIIRNKAYTGDGGVDGMVFMNMRRHLIQAKCYSSYITARELEDFIKTCRRRKVRGLFIHTGKTGERCRDIARSSDVTIISGKSMLNLFLGKPFRPKTEFTNLVNQAFSGNA